MAEKVALGTASELRKSAAEHEGEVQRKWQDTYSFQWQPYVDVLRTQHRTILT